LIRSVELQLPVLEGASLDMREVPLAQLGQRLYRRSGTEACEPLVEVAFHPVLGNDRAAGVRALLCADAIAILPVQIIPASVLLDDARNVGGIDDDGAPLLEHSDCISHRLDLVRIEPARPLL